MQFPQNQFKSCCNSSGKASSIPLFGSARGIEGKTRTHRFGFPRTTRLAPEKQPHRLPVAALLCGGLGEDMTKKTYSELLKDPQWQKVRLKKLEAAEWKCQSCQDTTTMLSVHHKHYVKGRLPWEYDDGELVVLCQPCHEAEHESKEIRNEFMARLAVDGPGGLPDFFAFGVGSVADCLDDPGQKSVANRVRERKGYQYYSGLIASNLSMYGVSRVGIERLAHLMDPGNGEADFLGDLFELLGKHGVELLGSPRREGENDQ